MAEGDSSKAIGAKALTAEQKAEKKFKKAVKAKKRQAERLGITFDKKKAKAEILKYFETAKSEKEDAGKNTSGSVQPNHEVDAKLEKTKSKKSKRSAEEAFAHESPVKKSKKSKKLSIEVESSTPTQNPEVEAASPKKKKEKSKVSSEETKKKSKSTLEDSEENEAETKKDKKSKSSKEESDRSPPSQSLEATNARVKKSTKKAKDTKSSQITKQARTDEKHMKKRAKKQAIAERKAEKLVQKASESKQENESNGKSAEQWNSDALPGDAARKSKFLRLLGAGKVKDDAASGNEGSKKSKKEIDLVQNELERQYETGMKMKYEMGAKRRGLGA
ncbi:small acidic protein family-domain-containing protein [Amylocarpus encephaloides]|uniref:Small acidic protein n=1 Tax=Amylocarpus encephaloides TaxID=45428 RepID=A0A9P7YBW5_9HELO|nr:small acidic protein family-domain-containing protein [Amylocarpus encephaloides]